MDKKLIHAVAGSGKTREIVESLCTNKRIAIITYTMANQEELKTRVIKKFGYMPDNIHIFGLFQFLYDFCIRPSGSFPKLKGFILANENPKYNQSYHNFKYFYSNMMSKYILDNKNEVNYLNRINLFFDCIYIDEVQDITSYDFDWILSLAEVDVDLLYFGDFYQKTFSSSNNGNKGKSIHSNFNNWKKYFIENGFKFDINSLNSSYRCSKSVCDFIKQVGIDIESNKIQNYEVREVIDEQEINLIMKNDSIKKLFYQKHYNYNCNSQNWGNSKGLEFNCVCVVLNKATYEKFKTKSLSKLATSTKCKFYVACTRTKGDLYFVEEKKLAKFKKSDSK